MGYKVAVIGATGNVGREILKILAERNFPADEVVALASSRSVGKEVSFGDDKILKVQDLEKYDFTGTDIALSSPGAKVSAIHSPRAAAAGCVVVDNTSHFRMDPDIPLVVPEVNPEAIGQYKTKGIIAAEAHIEKPEESAIFQKYPKVTHDHFAIELITDTLRMMTMNFENPLHVEDHINRQLDKHHHESTKPAEVMQGMADGLPALGIVAAVLGVIKTMASINEPPAVLGGMIGSALVGTFLGVFMAYGIAGPMASRLKQVYEEDHQFYFIIRDVLVAHLQGNAPQVSIEIGRGNVPTRLQPSFMELEEALNNIPPV